MDYWKTQSFLEITLKCKIRFLWTVLSEFRKWWLIFLRPSKQSVTNRQTQSHLILLKHDYMFRSTQTIISPPLQNFHYIPPYFESFVTMVSCSSQQAETCSHTSVKINVAVLFMVDCFGNAGKVKSSPCVYWSIMPLLALEKSVDVRIRHKEENQINPAKSQYTITQTYLPKTKLPYVGVHNLVPKWKTRGAKINLISNPTGRCLSRGRQNGLPFPKNEI